MERFSIFILLFVGVYYNVFSQEYNLFPSNQLSLYKDPNNEVFGLFFDEVSSKNYSDFRFGNAVSWTGKNIIIRGDSFLLTNIKNDTIILKPYSTLGKSWLSYSDSSGIKIIATVSKIEDLEFLSIVDSVKTITFQAYESSGDSIAHKINSQQIIISKNYGAVKWFNNYLFPDYSIEYPGFGIEGSYGIYQIDDPDSLKFDQLTLIGVQTPGVSFGKGRLSYKEIFNFEVGDEIHSAFLDCINWHGESQYTLTSTINRIKERIESSDSRTYIVDQELNVYTKISELNYAEVDIERDSTILKTTKITYDDTSFESLLPGQLTKKELINHVFISEDNRLLTGCRYQMFGEGIGGFYTPDFGPCPIGPTNNILYWKNQHEEKGIALKRYQEIIFDSIPDQLLGVNEIELTALASSGLPVTYSIISGNATIGLNKVVLKENNEGQIIIRASQNGNEFYKPARDAEQSFNIKSALSLDEDHKSRAIFIYPNPTSNLLTVKLKDKYNSEVSLLNINGKILKRISPNAANSLEIQVDNFSKGIYFLDVSQRNKRQRFKVVIY